MFLLKVPHVFCLTDINLSFKKMKRVLRSQVKACNMVEKQQQISAIKNSQQHNHTFDENTRVFLRRNLLKWYDTNKRDLQWREMAQHKDLNVRAYSVLVSEIMLQQTQVATVKPYYTRWMAKWPDVGALSKATLEEVNTLWSGLGYYSRGRRLYEAACKVMKEMDGIIPRTAESLEKQLPGVGPYTAAAIASIAYNEAVGLVDGNVVRVMTRLCSIGADVSRKNVMDAIWRLAHETVDPERPGDFNQALMELGATVCTPKSPSCDTCPMTQFCGAHRRATEATCDIEDVPNCLLCLPADQPWNPTDGVTNYPRKMKKTAPKPARNIVLVVERAGSSPGVMEYLLCQRPSTGLLANLWEFPSFPAAASAERRDDEESSELERALELLKPVVPGTGIERCRYVADVFHQFSHISQTYVVYRASVAVEVPCEPQQSEQAGNPPAEQQPFRWLSPSQISTTAISTAMKKVFERALARNDDSTTTPKRKAIPRDTGNGAKRRRRNIQ